MKCNNEKKFTRSLVLAAKSNAKYFLEKRVL